MVNPHDLQLAFVTWSDETSDREDPAVLPADYLALEHSLESQGAHRLECVADFMQRAWSPSKTDRPFIYIDIASVNIRTGDLQPIEIPENEAPLIRKKLCAGDIIVSTVRPERNAVAFVGDEYDGAICSTGFAVLKAKSGLDPYTLYAFLKSRFFIVQAVRRSTASMYPAVAEESLKMSWSRIRSSRRPKGSAALFERHSPIGSGFSIHFRRLVPRLRR